MIFNWSKYQQYFGAMIISYDSFFVQTIFEPGRPLAKHIFLADRRHSMFETSKKTQYFISKDERIKWR